MKLRSLGYFDSSVVAKRYLHEPGSQAASQLLRQYRFVSSRVTPIEIKSVFKRKFAAGDIAEKAFKRALRSLDIDRKKWELIIVGPALLDAAEELVQKHSIRTLDAIHVASALAVESRIGAKLPFITADVRQREAAARAGLKTISVE